MNELIEDERHNRWKRAVCDQLAICHIYTTEYESDPDKAIKALIEWHCQVVLDPTVSGQMADILQERDARTLEEAAKHFAEAYKTPWIENVLQALAAERRNGK